MFKNKLDPNNTREGETHKLTEQIAVCIEFHQKDEEKGFEETPTGTQQQHHQHENINVD